MIIQHQTQLLVTPASSYLSKPEPFFPTHLENESRLSKKRRLLKI